ncbi:IclR family transcriptional regulator domain-containing protein [Microvirga lotononidis]|uniref:Beta-ketoadipate pathway transcriptional regulator, PcaR/PcaU/PobR family n=1 Tax=Microvirga lotononidis TaxID=864069 RepID=I4Z0N8_9HYPH|nr:IclR family transcriptional regulator C-terminal domain-containing protein [Microvirga lotononidis]EIM29780.1 beta-ketoadipate pathway transcriptional regulator, PcaR/PcaU/PobR family [Microvirga lotononidis]WQO26922.1 IclR family transcriptional regulator C-terminal domain-containing protein [Microvirga lotononidis]
MQSDEVEEQGNDRDFVASLEKGLLVIEAFDASRPRLTLSDVAKLTGITRAAARRYLLTLAKLNYADFDGRYFSLSPRILRLGYAYLSSASLSTRVQPFLEQISEATGESSSAAILDGDDIVYVARSATRRIMSIGLGVGSRLPAYCTSLGRAILAYQSEDMIEAYLRRVRLEARTPKTIIDKTELRNVLKATRDQGFAIVNEELEFGLRSIAVPVIQKSGQVTIALNLSAQAGRVSADDMRERFLPSLTAASESLRYLL